MTVATPPAGRVIASALLVMAIAAPDALATFPGKNGEIAYDAGVGFGDAEYVHPYAVCPDASRIRRLRVPRIRFQAESSTAVFSPDGRSIAFTFDGRIYLASADGSHRRRLTSPGRESGDSSPAWSPDGQSVAFNRRSQGKAQILIYHRGRIRLLTDDGIDPKWSSRGIIAFTGRRGIHLINPISGRNRFLTRGFAPDWAPDGRRLVYQTSRSILRSDLALISTRDSQRRRLTRTSAIENDPIFSPDGRWIAFTHSERGGLYVRRVDGRRSHVISRGGRDTDADVLRPTSWRPAIGRCSGRGPKPNG
jgi:Tol biopolymer transport system component